jgi:hypothetical protein
MKIHSTRAGVLVGAEPLVATGLRAPEYIGGTATPRRSILPKPVAFSETVCPPVYVRAYVRLADRGTTTPRRSVLPKPVAFSETVCPPVYVHAYVRLADLSPIIPICCCYQCCSFVHGADLVRVLVPLAGKRLLYLFSGLKLSDLSLHALRAFTACTCVIVYGAVLAHSLVLLASR